MLINTGYQVAQKPDTIITQRIVADSENRLWIFFQSHYRSLAFGTSEDGGRTWSAPRELLPDISGPFSACAGARGSVYVAASKTNPPDISLLVWDGCQWSEGVLPVSEKQKIIASPMVSVDNVSGVHVIYAARGYFSGEWAVKNSLWDTGSGEISSRPVPPLSAPQPEWPSGLEFLKESLYWTGDIALDSKNNLHLACSVFSGTHYQVYHTLCSGAGGQWEAFTPLTATSLHSSHPKLIPGQGGSGVHAFFHREKEQGYSLTSIFRSPAGKWGSEKTLAEGLPDDFPPQPVNTPYGPVLYWSDGSGVNRSFIEVSSPAEKIVGEKVTSFAAAASREKVFLACTGLSRDKTAIFLAQDSI